MTAKDKDVIIKNKLFSKLDNETLKNGMEIITVKKGETVMTKSVFNGRMWCYFKVISIIRCKFGYKSIFVWYM